MWNVYYAEQSPHTGRMTIRCPVCGSPYCDNPFHKNSQEFFMF